MIYNMYASLEYPVNNMKRVYISLQYSRSKYHLQRNVQGIL